MLFLLALPALLLTSVLLYAAFPLRGRLAAPLAWACLSFGQVVLLTEILSELVLLTAAGYAVGHLLLLAGAVGLWWWRGRPALTLNPAPSGRGTSKRGPVIASSP
jgi:hypothetical protein